MSGSGAAVSVARHHSTGTVTSINEALAANPELVNSDPYGEGWMVKLSVSDTSEMDELLDGPAYDDLVAAG